MSECGHKPFYGPSGRQWRCPQCQAEQDRAVKMALAAEQEAGDAEFVRVTSELTIAKIVKAIGSSPRKSDQELADHIRNKILPVTLQEVREKLDGAKP